MFLLQHEQFLSAQFLLVLPGAPQYFLLLYLPTIPNCPLKHESLQKCLSSQVVIFTYQVVVLAAITFDNDNSLCVRQFADHFHISSIAHLKSWLKVNFM